MQIGPRMISRPQYEVDLLLDHIRLTTVEADLMTALIISPVLLIHRVVSIRSGVIEGISLRKILDRRLHARERPAHSGLTIRLPDSLMASGTDGAVNVASVRT